MAAVYSPRRPANSLLQKLTGTRMQKRMAKGQTKTRRRNLSLRRQSITKTFALLF